MELREEYDDQGLIPDLPDEVAYRCLSRVSIRSHAQLHGVSRKWSEFVSSREFYEQRKQEGATKHCVCMLQALPRTHSSQYPVYGVSVMNEESELWEWLPPIPEFSHYGLPLFCRFASVNEMLLVLGGWHPRTWETLRTVYVFNFATRRWHRGADMPSTRSSFACQALGSYVLVAGGHDNAKNALSSAEVYSTEKDSWKILPNMNDSRDECSSAVIDEEFHVISGYQTSSQYQFVQSSEMFKPKLNKWTRTDMALTHATAGSIVTSSTRSEAASAASSCVQEDDLHVNIKPRTNLHNAATQLPLFGFYDRQLVSYSIEKDEWQVLDVLPEGDDSIMTPVCITALGTDKLFVTGPQNKDTNSFTSLIYNRSSPTTVTSDTPGSCTKKLEKLHQDQHPAAPAHQQQQQLEQQDHHDQHQNFSPNSTNFFPISSSTLRGKWEFLKPSKKFQGVILTTCVVEI